ncbi:DUF202 domain-containing protein [Corynebacterium crudilactis]|uniref:DUF202 domain-containing protein n=1 Tax=Corynebacterium crudilactis TaxID=1652495 RepID=A0A172QQW5_9CORY|nr:DUF202 domain-containing protein [Corynebacterium crudilactis]ANE03069.1 hypothetical protein ccrud_01795 [Corynebacterium crudilactis]
MSSYLAPLHSDPGLQPERTILAWNRTTVSMAVCTAVILRWTNFYGAAILIPVAFLVGLAMFILVTQKFRYHRQSLGLANETISPNLIGVTTMTLTLLLFGGAGVFFVVVN